MSRHDISNSGQSTTDRDLWVMLSADVLILLFAFLTWSGVDAFSQEFTTLAAVSTLCLGMIAWFALRHYQDLESQGFLIFQAGFAYWYLLPMLMTALRGETYVVPDFRTFPAAHMRQGCIAVLLARLTGTLIYQLIRNRPIINVKRITEALNAREFRLPVVVLLGQLALGFVPFLASGRPVLETILGSRSAAGVFPTSNFGNVSFGFLFTFPLVSCCLLGLQWFLLDRNGRSRWIFLVPAVMAFAIMALGFSTRTTLLAMIMPMVSTYAIGSPDRWRVVKVIACLVAIWFGAEILVKARHSEKGFLEGNPLTREDSRSGNLKDNDFYGELLYAMEVVPDEYPFTYESPLVELAVTVIPRAIWPGKPYPENAANVTLMRLRSTHIENITGSILPGIIGQYWEVAGWFGVIVSGMWYGAAIALSDRVFMAGNWHVRYQAFSFAWALFISFRTLALSIFAPLIIAIATLLFFSKSRLATQT